MDREQSMKKVFVEPEVNVVELDSTELITTSCDDHYCFECTNCYTEFSE